MLFPSHQTPEIVPGIRIFPICALSAACASATHIARHNWTIQQHFLGMTRHEFASIALVLDLEQPGMF